MRDKEIFKSGLVLAKGSNRISVSRKCLRFIFTFVLAVILPCASNFQVVKADQYDDFVNSGQHNNVISDGNFLDINSMTVQQIQDFLISKGSYLKDFVDTSDAGKGRSAAQIIWDSAHGKYQAGGSFREITINESTGTINPKLILVYLQKEQSLITRTSWDDWAMLASLGYNCFAGVTGDNNDNNCKDIYEGFTNQVENGAWQLRYNYEAAVKEDGWWNQYYGNGHYQVDTSINTSDGYQVNLTNRATASVYRYTPYVFYSAYNVWNLFNNVYFSNSVPIQTGTNDTSEYRLTSYDSSFTINGGKTTDSKAYLDDKLIADLASTSWSTSFECPIGETTHRIYYRTEDESTLAEKIIVIRRYKMSDINFDGAIDISDLAIFAENWGKGNPPEKMADFNADNVVDITDLAIFADNWGK